jgi:hypothetical protein
MSQPVVDLLREGSQANLADAYRHGNLVCLPSVGSLVVSGDIHGHRRNFERITTLADLANHPECHVVLQEIIHGGPQDAAGGCLSYQLLFDAVRLKVKFPDRVHFLMGNHDTAFITNAEVVKDGREMNRAMSQAMAHEFGQSWPQVESAIREFLLSQPLAVRTDHRIWLSHSLPADRLVDQFDPQVMDRPLQVSDCEKPGSAYILTWGRNMSRRVLDHMARVFDVDLFVVGHQPQPDGWYVAGPNLLILASEHNHGCLLRIDLTRPCTLDDLTHSIIPVSSIA